MRLSAKLFNTVSGLVLLVACPAGLAAQDRSMTLPTSTGETKVEIWDAVGDAPKGVILFGTGWRGNPDGYDALLKRLAGAGYTVFAPVTLDSEQHPGHGTVDADTMAGAQAFIGDRMVATLSLRGWLAETYPETPMVLAGHSFGSFVSLTNAEGRWAFGPLTGPPVAAVLAFSSPGEVPQLVGEASYSTLDLPMMMITGTEDGGSGTFPTWEAHRLAFDRSVAGDKYLVVFEGGDHALAHDSGEEWLPRAATIGETFLDAYVAKNAESRALMETLEASNVRIERR